MLIYFVCYRRETNTKSSSSFNGGRLSPASTSGKRSSSSPKSPASASSDSNGLSQYKVQFSSHEQLLGFLYHLLRTLPIKAESLLTNDVLQYIEMATGYPAQIVKAYLQRQSSNNNSNNNSSSSILSLNSLM